MLPALYWRILVLQRNFPQLFELCYAALPMGDIRRVVPPLPVGDDFHHCRRVECPSRQEARQQHLYLGSSQARGFFLT